MHCRAVGMPYPLRSSGCITTSADYHPLPVRGETQPCGKPRLCPAKLLKKSEQNKDSALFFVGRKFFSIQLSACSHIATNSFTIRKQAQGTKPKHESIKYKSLIIRYIRL